jgi:hypothetical protein
LLAADQRRSTPINADQRRSTPINADQRRSTPTENKHLAFALSALFRKFNVP